MLDHLCFPVNVLTMKREITVPQMIGARLKGKKTDLTPLVELWMKKNPNVNTSHLVRQGLKLALAEVAGKRLAHLLKD